MNRSVTFKIQREITTSEQNVLFEWGADIFGGSEFNLQWRPTDIHVIGYLDGQPVTHVGIVKHSVGAGETHKVVGGIGAVVTVPQMQKQGVAKECILRAHTYMRSDLNVEYGFLFCPDRLVNFYGSLGWKKITEKVLIDQPKGVIVAPLCSMVLEFSAQWPVGTVNLGSLPW